MEVKSNGGKNAANFPVFDVPSPVPAFHGEHYPGHRHIWRHSGSIQVHQGLFGGLHKVTLRPQGGRGAAIQYRLGVESYPIHDDATTIKFEFLDISYLLPIPIVNITIGIGGGKVDLSTGSYGNSGNATQFWVSAGFPIIPLFDLHVGFHKVDASIHDDALTLEFNGNMISVGAMFNF